MPSEKNHRENGFTKALLTILLVVPMVTIGLHISSGFPKKTNRNSTEAYHYDFQEIHAQHLSFRKWWGTDAFLLFNTKQKYAGVLIYEKPDPSEQTYSGFELMAPFFQMLHNKNSQVRIAYYGDSGIEADLVTQTLRDSLQKKFGGAGVGFMPVMSRDPGYRKSIYHYFSNLWRWESLENPSPMKNNPGISGNSFYTRQNDSISEQTAWISYKGKAFSTRTRNFPSMRFFYGKNELDSVNGFLEWEINETTKTASLQKNELLNEIRLFDFPVSQIRIKAIIPSSLPVYGCSIESDTGVVLDNFALRGIDGSKLSRIPHRLLQAFQSKLNYDLIIFSYGLNVVNPSRIDFSTYEEKISRLIKHYKRAFPGIPILLIGPPDKGMGSPGNMVSDPSIPRITKVMRRAAIRNETAFISLYELMGGNGSMVRWVDIERPRLAGTDYTHFNFEGADRISRQLFQIFLSETAAINQGEIN